jgi:acetolactate synthase-1/3 small subunit
MAQPKSDKRSKSAPAEQAIERHTVAVLVDNEPGVLARVIGLFSGRGYNIESLTVAQVEVGENLSRITIVTSGTPMVIEQIKAQLARLVPVHDVHDLTAEGKHIERDLALIRVVNAGDKRIEALRIADVFHARAVDATTRSFVFEMTDSTENIDRFVALMRELGKIEVVRSGVVAIAYGDGKN